MEIKSFDELINQVRQAPVKNVAIAAASDMHSIEAGLHALEESISIPIFIGDGAEIENLIKSKNVSPDTVQIIDEKDRLKTPIIASKLVNSGEADFIMKGFIDTSDFLRGILNKEDGLRTGKTMSHLAFLQVPGYGKLMAVTDAGMITQPDYETKKEILDNAVQIFKGMGYDLPKIAAVTAVEKLNKAMPETLDAEKLQTEYMNGTIGDCVIEGPVSYDIVVSKESAKLKGFNGKYSEEYDVLLVPNISAGNILAKALMYNADSKMSGIIAGAKVPLVVNSRSSSTEEKFYAIALAAAGCMHN